MRLSLSLPLLLLPLTAAGPSYSPLWHKQHIGIPTLNSDIHRVPRQNKTVLVVASRSVVAGLNPGDGDLVWRQVHDEDDLPIAHKSSGQLTATLSGPSGSFLRLYTPHTGELVREFALHPPREAQLLEPQSLGVGIDFIPTGEGDEEDVLVLTNGRNVRRVGEDGVKWIWEEEIEEGKVNEHIYTTLSTSQTYIHLLALSSPPPSKLVHTLLSPSGTALSTHPLPFPPLDASSPLLVLHPHTAVTFIDGHILSVHLAQPEKGYKLKMHKGRWKGIVDVGLGKAGLVVGIRDDGASEVLRAKDDGSLDRAWEFSDSATAAHYSESIFAGALDKTGSPHVARVYWTHTLNMASVHVYSAAGPPGPGGDMGMVTGFTFPFATKLHGTMQTVALEIGIGPRGQVIPRMVLTSSTGSLQLWQDDKEIWVREEALGEVVERGVGWAQVEPELGKMSEEGWAEKIGRHVGMLWRLPFYTISFARHYLSPTPAPLPPSSASPLGISKLLLLATQPGKLFALNTVSGEIVWERILGVSGAPAGQGKVDVEWVGEVGGVGWVVVGTRHDPEGVLKTAAWEIVPETGKIMPPPGKQGMTNGFPIFDGRIVEAFVLKPDGNAVNETVVLVDEHHQIHIWPDDETRVASVSYRAPTLHFSLPSTHAPAQLLGYKVLAKHDTFSTLQTFSTPLTSSPASTVLSIIRPPQGPVASYGRVLGDMSTLYKYLNRHLVVVLTSFLSEEGLDKCGVHVVDEVSGAVVWETSVRAASGRGCGVQASLVDNWLVYHWWDDRIEGQGVSSKGWRVVTVEMYEGGRDERTRSLELSSSAANSTRINAIVQSYGFPSAIHTMTTTSTKYGITLKDILVANDRAQVQAFPRQLLDPRRPKGKPTSEEKEELLIPFDAVIPDDARRVISKHLQVVGITRLSTTPTLLESTSLVLAYGLDLFLGRVSPSSTFDILSESFNKPQLLLTVAALVVGIAIVKPIVDRKRIQQRWYTT